MNLCKLKVYVERKLSGQETASCQKDVPSPQPGGTLADFVGMQALKAKAILDNQGIKTKWRSGSIAKDAGQQSLIEKQKPAAGAVLNTVKEVELWVYRYAAQMVAVPKVTGMTYDEAAARLKREGLVARKGQTLPTQDKSKANRVSMQGTAAGTKVANGASVVLRYSVYDAPEEKTKPETPQKVVKSDPASAFGGRKEPAAASVSGTMPPSRFSCDAGIPGIRVVKERKVASQQYGQVKVMDYGRANYPCWYSTAKGSTVVKTSFFVTKPERPKDDKRYGFKVHCDAYAARYPEYHKGAGTSGKAVFVEFDHYTIERLGQQAAQQLVRFHLNQILPYAVSCR